MSCDPYIAFQGKIIKQVDYPFTLENRAFLYGDQCFETIKIINQKPCFIDLHLLRLKKSTEILQLFIDIATLHETIVQLILKNKVKDGRIKILAYRSDGGKYMPKQNTSIVLMMTYSDGNPYTLNKTGLQVGICESTKKISSPFGFFKSSQSLPYILASLEKQNRGLDDLFLLNEKGLICEAISSNVFALHNNILFTPPLSDGCIDGIMRSVLFDVANQIPYRVEEKTLTVSFLKECDELFVCNSQQGIQWIEGLDEKKYSNSIVSQLAKVISDLN